MSGFAGIVNLDGAPVDPILIERMTRSLAFRGPDAQEVWCDGPVGLGHSLLQIPDGRSPGRLIEKQPAQLDGRLWIVADARIDARTELIDKLRGKGQSEHTFSLSASIPVTDAELILHAYDSWGEACVDHLLGDFSFAIWDAREKRLFCGRDQFGVKPFYYAKIGSCFIFSNTLDCVRLHPAVSSRLNDLAIADFLLFDMNMDSATTSFADIRRLPPAHKLSCRQETQSVRRYWELSVTTPIHYSRDEEYIERFSELLDTAVADRLRTDSAGIMLSGGLDSTTVAASAQRIFHSKGQGSGLHASTVTYDSLIPHEERHYTKLAADALKIPVEFLIHDHLKIFEHATQPANRTPEPTHSAWPDTTGLLLCGAAARSRVVLTGYGADPALSGRISVHFRQLLGRRQYGRAAQDAARYIFTEGRLSRLYLRKRWGLLFQSKKNSAGYPPWLSEDLEAHWKLRDRWQTMDNHANPIVGVRPEAIDLIINPSWIDLFEGCDPGVTHMPVEVRHPFFDLRLASFLLALPRLPWCCDKQLLRDAARGVLPDSVRLRRKSPLISEPLVALLQRPESAWVDRFEPLDELERYVCRSRIPAVYGEKDSWTGWVHLRPLSLNFWLHQTKVVS